MTEQGTCFGFAIQSDLPFQFLRRGRGERLVVEAAQVDRPTGEAVLQWDAAAGMPFSARLYGTDRAWSLSFEGVGTFQIDSRAPRVVVPSHAEPVRREERALGLPMLLCFLARGDLPLHAAAVEFGEGAVLFAGMSTAGKTTLAAACAGAGHRLLTEDLSCCRPGPSAVLVPGPAGLRLRRDVVGKFPLPEAEVVLEEDDRMHLAVADAERGDGEPVALRAVVFLRDGEECAIERVDAAASLQRLWTLSFNLPNDDDRARCFIALADLAASVPVYELRRPRTFSALPATIADLEKAFGG